MSSDTRSIPCAEWAEKLAALHPDDLTPAEQDELRSHLAVCSDCAQVYRDYHYLASMVCDLAASEATPDLLPELPELPNVQEEAAMRDIPVFQPGITSSLPTRVPGQRPRRIVSIAAAVIAAVLIVGVVLMALRGQPPAPRVVSQGYEPGSATRVVSQGHGPIYYVTPPGGPLPASTPQINPGGPMVLANPTPPFFIDGNVYRDSDAYRAATGAFVQQYLKELGNVTIYNPKLVDGTLYMAVRAGDRGPGKMEMYALRVSDGTVLWEWDDCGESVNMTPPIVINRAVYFICENAPGSYRLYALQASTGTLLWHDILPGEANLGLLADQQALYVQTDNQILAERLDTGVLLWKRSFGQQNDYLDRAALGNGILYIVQGETFYALQASTGTFMWEYYFVGDHYIPDPVVAQNSVYLFVTRQSGITSIYALDGATGVMSWQKQLGNIDYSFPVVDQGNLYMAIDVFANSQQLYPSHFTRVLLAIQGSDGRTLWLQDIPWNKSGLGYSMIVPPMVSIGDGRIYLVDWQPSSSPNNLKATMGAFSESNGALLWTKDVTQIW
ncbi:MAG: PQQ-binding-like beta-propeller repeat protein [Ktedonobacteraceae bacterium]